MRHPRFLALFGLLVPALASAQAAGSIVAYDGDDLNINGDECASTTAKINLAWRVSGTLSNGAYRVYASDRQWTKIDGIDQCATEDDTDPVTTAGRVGSVDIDATAQDTIKTGEFNVSEFLEQSGRECEADDGETIYVCVHFLPYDINNVPQSPPTASAVGKLTLATARPDAPTEVRLTIGDTRLYASWTAPDGESAEPADYLIEAVPTSAGLPTRRDSAAGTSGKVDGLTNDQEYAVVVYSRTASGTKSEASNPVVFGTPRHVKDFWELYGDTGGPEQGGCGGPAGPLALLALVGGLVLARLRRAP